LKSVNLPDRDDYRWKVAKMVKIFPVGKIGAVSCLAREPGENEKRRFEGET